MNLLAKTAFATAVAFASTAMGVLSPVSAAEPSKVEGVDNAVILSLEKGVWPDDQILEYTPKSAPDHLCVVARKAGERGGIAIDCFKKTETPQPN